MIGYIGNAGKATVARQWFPGNSLHAKLESTLRSEFTVANWLGANCIQRWEKCSCVLRRYPPPSRWSTCSRNVLTSFLASSKSYCLNDFNNVLYDTTAVCGNGIVETGEQCDCGKAPITVIDPTTTSIIDLFWPLQIPLFCDKISLLQRQNTAYSLKLLHDDMSSLPSAMQRLLYERTKRWLI